MTPAQTLLLVALGSGFAALVWQTMVSLIAPALFGFRFLLVPNDAHKYVGCVGGCVVCARQEAACRAIQGDNDAPILDADSFKRAAAPPAYAYAPGELVPMPVAPQFIQSAYVVCPKCDLLFCRICGRHEAIDPLEHPPTSVYAACACGRPKKVP